MPKTEKAISDQIKLLSKKGIQVTENMIRDLARQYYVSPWIIAERSTFQYFITNGKQIFKDENKSQYTDEFEQMFDELLSNFSNDKKYFFTKSITNFSFKYSKK